MSSKNIFEVLQNIAENTESNEKFLNILKENGFTGTLEEAENQINQQTQVVLNNLTTEDLQNIAGGKSLMNDKLKKAIAVGGASLMAAGTVTPDSLAVTKNDAQQFATRTLKHVEENPVHTAVTSILGVATILLSAKSAFGGKDKSGLHFTDAHKAFLWDKDLSKGQVVLTFIEQLSDEDCTFEVTDTEGPNKITFTATKDGVLTDTLLANEKPISFTTEAILKTLTKAMDKGNKYVEAKNTLTDEGASVLNTLAPYIVQQVNTAIDTKEEAKVMKGQLGKAVTKAKEEEAAAKTVAENKNGEANKAKSSENLNSKDAATKKNAEDAKAKAVKEASEAEKDYKEKTAAVKAAEEKLQQEIQKAKAAAKKLEMPAKPFQKGEPVDNATPKQTA